MSNYTLKHSQTTTQINAVINSGGFSEQIQYEFKESISDYKIQKVYDSLTKVQQENVGRHKTGFKQFVRAILLAYPSNSSKIETLKSRSDEAKRYMSRVAPHVNLASNQALGNYINSGTLSVDKYKRMIDASPSKVVLEDEKLVYLNLGEFVIVAGLESVVREKGAGERYIYAMFATTVKD